MASLSRPGHHPSGNNSPGALLISNNGTLFLVTHSVYFNVTLIMDLILKSVYLYFKKVIFGFSFFIRKLYLITYGFVWKIVSIITLHYFLHYFIIACGKVLWLNCFKHGYKIFCSLNYLEMLVKINKQTNRGYLDLTMHIICLR